MSKFEYAGEMYLIAGNRQQAADDSGHGGEKA